MTRLYRRGLFPESAKYRLGRAISIVSGEHFAWESMNENSPKVGPQVGPGPGPGPFLNIKFSRGQRITISQQALNS